MTKKAKKQRPTAADTLSLPVWKNVYTVTVYSPEQISGHCELENVMREMDTGEFIGMVELGEQKIIDPKHVRRALKRIGNDGAFFDREPDDDP